MIRRTLERHPVYVDGLGSISLEELNSIASLQERVDRKYVLPADVLADVLGGFGGHLAVLTIGENRNFAYESVYFDTASLESYLGAAHRRRRRFKVRTRTYLDSCTTMLEIKTRGMRGRTVKRRQPHEFDDRDRLGSTARRFVDETTDRPGLGEALAPTLTTTYRRTTLIDPVDVTRVTIDADVRCSDWTSAEIRLADRMVVETKSAGVPSALDRALWGRGIRPAKISKFGTGLAALHPDLPSNKWHRTLQRHFP